MKRFSIIAILTVAVAATFAVFAMPVPADAGVITGEVLQGFKFDSWMLSFGAAGMLLNSANLQGLTTGFRANFNQGFNSAETHFAQLATTVPSTTSKESYPWLGDLPGIREWLGDRQVHKLGQHDYTIKNKSFEMTIGVDKDAVEDDQYGVYAPLMSNMGFETARFPDQMVFELLAAGFEAEGYDGQPFFDTDHLGYDADGKEVSVSNDGGGSGTPWFLLDTSRPLKPLIYQERQKFNFVPKTALTDENVFNLKQFIYGVDGRMNVGFGFWQQAYGARTELNDANFDAAMAAMMSIKKRSGKPMGIKPRLLVVGPSLRSKALDRKSVV